MLEGWNFKYQCLIANLSFIKKNHAFWLVIGRVFEMTLNICLPFCTKRTILVNTFPYALLSVNI